jgi:DNA-binding NarL/FixJ family response regulator
VDCPIVTISTGGTAADRQAALAAGANLYLVKPVGTERLQLIAATVIAGAVAARPAAGTGEDG